MIRESFYRVLKRKRFYLLIFIIFFVNALDVLPRAKFPIITDKLILQSAYLETIMGNGSLNKGYIAFIFMAFILAALPMSDCFVEDKESGIDKIYLLKVPKSKYIKSRFFINFFYGGFMVSVVIFINLLIWLMIRPTFAIYYYNTSLVNNLFLIDLLIDSPILFYLVILLRLFFIGGVIASFAMFLNEISKSRYIGLGGVFILDIIVTLIISIVRDKVGLFESYKSIFELLGGFISNVTITSFIYPIILLVIPLVYFFVIKKDREVLWGHWIGI